VVERWSVELRPNNHISPEAAITGICKADRGDVTSVLALEEDDIYFTLPLDCDDLHKVIRMIRVCLLEQVDLAQPHGHSTSAGFRLKVTLTLTSSGNRVTLVPRFTRR
jgi:hypothetical protein